MERYNFPMTARPIVSDDGEYVKFDDAEKEIKEEVNKVRIEMTEECRELEDKHKELQDEFFKLKAKYREAKRSACTGFGSYCPNFTACYEDNDEIED